MTEVAPTSTPADRKTVRGFAWSSWFWRTAIVVGAFAGYVGALSAPFIFDDLTAIVGNPSIRDLGELGEVLLPTHIDSSGVAGRPVVNLTFAVDLASWGWNPAGFRVFNILVHATAGLFLFALIRGVLRRPMFAESSLAVRATPFAGVVALVWAVHPLQTESVTCIVQRTESLFGLVFLATFWALLRACDSPRPLRWRAAAVLLCLVGMGTKEVMVVAPVLLVLFDRTFVSGSFAQTWRRHRVFHLCAFATWFLLAGLLVRSGGQRGAGAGFGLGVTAWEYLLTQADALVLYLRLAFWPHPLVLDYGTNLAPGLGAVLPQALLVTTLLGATVFALWRRPVAGFVGAWFFVILAPSSSVVPLVAQTIAEHRMYLPLAAVCVSVAAGIVQFAPRALVPGGIVVAAVFSVATAVRNHDYRTERSIWEDTVAKVPGNARAHANLGRVAYMEREYEEAVAHGLRALELEPRAFDPAYNVGMALAALGRDAEAASAFERAVRLHPAQLRAWSQLGFARLRADDSERAVEAFERVLAGDPASVEGLLGYGLALAANGDEDAAIGSLRRVLDLDATHVVARFQLGMGLARAGRAAEALPHLEEAARLAPGWAEVRGNLGAVLAELGRLDEAIAAYEEAVRLDPAYVNAHYNYGEALLKLGRWAEAGWHFRKALELAPDFTPAREALARLPGGR
ncbi:tetratricopeptide repeat protein [Congregicoccus parvus]|uniref:tetratricopeptide repeat protein n=1 Tax=Congregicoccus parvus TaxID=3081749 RepID=UPI003FA5D29D